MKNVITVAGVVSTDPRKVVTDDGLDIVSFRLASTHVNHDPLTSSWVDPDVNWFIVTAFRQLAVNTHTSVSRGDRIIVTGGLRIREWATAERSGTQVEIEASIIGHDLNWGNSDWHYTSAKTSSEEETVAEAENTISDTGHPATSSDPVIPEEAFTAAHPPAGEDKSAAPSSGDHDDNPRTG